MYERKGGWALRKSCWMENLSYDRTKQSSSPAVILYRGSCYKSPRCETRLLTDFFWGSLSLRCEKPGPSGPMEKVGGDVFVFFLVRCMPACGWMMLDVGKVVPPPRFVRNPEDEQEPILQGGAGEIDTRLVVLFRLQHRSNWS